MFRYKGFSFFWVFESMFFIHFFSCHQCYVPCPYYPSVTSLFHGNMRRKSNPVIADCITNFCVKNLNLKVNSHFLLQKLTGTQWSLEICETCINAVSSEVSIHGCQGNHLFQTCDISCKVMKQFYVHCYHRAHSTIIVVDKIKLFPRCCFYQDFSCHCTEYSETMIISWLTFQKHPFLILTRCVLSWHLYFHFWVMPLCCLHFEGEVTKQQTDFADFDIYIYELQDSG
jgi:hypothetical protein